MNRIIEGFMEMAQKVAHIGGMMMSKMKRNATHISSKEEKVLGEVIGVINQQLDELEKGIESVGNTTMTTLDFKISNHIETVEDEKVIEFAQKEETTFEEATIDRVEMKKLEQQGEANNIIYIDKIPSVVRIDKKKGAVYKSYNRVHLDEKSERENKGSIHPLHRSIEATIKRVNVHSREPTWEKWKDM